MSDNEVVYQDGYKSKHTPAQFRERTSTRQYIFAFPNGYGASLLVSTGPGSIAYGGLELAVLATEGDPTTEAFQFGLIYDTPVTNDVIGWIETPAEVEQYLDEIAALPKRNGPVESQLLPFQN